MLQLRRLAAAAAVRHAAPASMPAEHNHIDRSSGTRPRN